MNPLAHIDPIGFLCMILAGIGFGKSIQFSSRNYRNIKRDGAIQILSAPAAGLILAFCAAFLDILMYSIGVKTGMETNQTYSIFMEIIRVTCEISIVLTVFHLLPLPGFDSYRLVANFLPYKYYRKLYNIEKYSLFILAINGRIDNKNHMSIIDLTLKINKTDDLDCFIREMKEDKCVIDVFRNTN